MTYSLPHAYAVFCGRFIITVTETTCMPKNKVNSTVFVYTDYYDLMYGLDCKSNTVLEFCRDRCFFLVQLPKLSEICMSKRSCCHIPMK